MQKANILDAVKIINDTVKKFEGSRRFLSTGDLDFTEIKGLENVTYINRPSRANQNVQKGDIILARMQGTVKVNIIDSKYENIIVSTGFLVLRCKKDVYNRYLFHYLKSNLFQSKKDKLCSGATQKAINNNKFAEIQVPLPDLTTQQKIAAILDKADELRQYNKQLIEKYDTLTQSLFLEMFGNITNNKKFPIGTIEDFIEIIRDGPHVSPSYVDDGVPILSTRNIRPFELVNEEIKYVSTETYKELTRKFKPRKGDVLLTKGGTTGFAKVVDWDWDFCIWVHIAALRVKKDVSPKYIEAALNSHYCYNQSQELTHGIANKDLGLKRMIKIKLPNPSVTVQNQFAERIQVIESQKQQAQEALAKSEALFQGLLQQAFKGELN